MTDFMASVRAFELQDADSFKLKMNSPSHPLLPFREAAIRASENLAASTSLPIYIGMGGGLLSEVVAETFRAARVPFHAAILRFSNDLNIHDTSRAVIYCETRGLAYKFFEFDAVNFFKRDYAKFNRAVGTEFSASPTTSALVRQIKGLGGFAVLGGGLPRIVERRSGYVSRIDESGLSLEKWATVQKIKCETQFFSSDVNLFSSYLKEVSSVTASNVIGRLPQILGKPDGLSLNLVIRNHIFTEHFNLRSRKSYTGYEKLADRHPDLRETLKTAVRERGRSRQWALAKENAEA